MPTHDLVSSCPFLERHRPLPLPNGVLTIGRDLDSISSGKGHSQLKQK